MKHAMWAGLVLLFVCGSASAIPGVSSETPYGTPDVNGDGYVDFFDILLLQESWHGTPRPTLTPAPTSTPTPSPTSTPIPIVIASEVIIVDNETAYTYVASTTDTLTLVRDGLGGPDIDPVDILVGTGGEGFLRRVIEAETSGDQVYLHTEQASLAEAIQSGDIGITLVLAAEPEKSFSLVGGQRSKSTAAEPLSWDISGTTLYQDSTFNLEVTNGRITFNPIVNIDCELDTSEITVFEAAVRSDVELLFDIHASALKQGSWQKEFVVPGLEWSHTFTQWITTPIGLFPVRETVTVRLVAGVTAYAGAGASAETGFNAQASLTLGARYEDHSWRNISDAEFGSTVHYPSILSNGTLDVRVHLRPEISVIFYYFAGPTIGLEPYAHYSGRYSLVPPICDFTLDAGVDATLALDAQVFDFKLFHWDRSFSLWNRRLASGSCAPSGRARYAYVAANREGLIILDVSDPKRPAEVGRYTYSPDDRPPAHDDVVVVGSLAYVAADEAGGLLVVDITDPARPGLIGRYDTPGEAEGLAVLGDYAYLADEWEGIRIVDISNPMRPYEVGSLSDGRTYARAVDVSGSFVYSDWQNRLSILDISDPVHPRERGYVDRWPGAIHVSENLAYVAGRDGAFWIIDISDPDDPDVIGLAPIIGSGGDGVAIAEEYAYASFSVDGPDRFSVIDVTNPSYPQEVASLPIPEAGALIVNEDFVFMCGGNEDLKGMSIINVSDPTDPVTIGFYPCDCSDVDIGN